MPDLDPAQTISFAILMSSVIPMADFVQHLPHMTPEVMLDGIVAICTVALFMLRLAAH